jgi:hypothetical protein
MEANANITLSAPNKGKMKTVQLYDLFQHYRFVLVVFLSLRDESQLLNNLKEQVIQNEASFVHRHRDWFHIFVVKYPHDALNDVEAVVEPNPMMSVLLDSDDVQAHTKYGALSGGCYLIRPDGYVAYESHHPDLSVFDSHLNLYLH